MEPMKVEEEYKKNKDLKKKDVKNILDWAETQQHLPKISELEAILFLHSCYYEEEPTKHTIDMYYTLRTQAPDLFGNWDPFNEQIKKDMEVMTFQPLPEPTKEGYKIIFMKYQIPDTSKFNMADQVRIFLMATKLWLIKEGTAQGHLILMDMTGVSTGHLLKMNPFVLKKFFYFLQEAIPFRLKGFHFFNGMSIIDKVMAILRPFIKDDLLHTYASDKMENMYKCIPKKCFPIDYGGEAPSTIELHGLMKKRLIENADYLLEVEKTHIVDETLRPDDGKQNCVIS